MDDVELPRWRSHKIVQADKITGVQFTPDPRMLLACGCHIMVPPDVWLRINGMVARNGHGETWPALIGGYYVRYADGYESWSPAQAFEQGYTRHE